jgi:quinolinate synthase
VHMLSTSGMLDHVASHPDGSFVVATENGMLYPLQQAAPHANLVEANRMAFCRYMKMITLPKLRDSLRDLKHEVRVPAAIAERARLPIERMIQIG